MNTGENGTGQDTSLPSGFELRSRLLLEEGVSRIDAHTRSRLNQARQAAAAAKPAYLTWLRGPATRRTLMPAGAAAAAVLVAAFVLGGGGLHLTTPAADNPPSSLDVLDMVTDDDAMNLVEDNDNSFYEWAAAQGDAAQAAGGATT